MDKGDSRAQGLCIIISAPSGTGKTTMCRMLLDRCPSVKFSVSFTTRAPRPGEEDGKDYWFISESSFRERISQGEFLEWVEHFGQLYGTSGKTVASCLEQGWDLIIDVEPRGARALKNSFPEGVFVFVLPPSLEELRTRLEQRGMAGEEEIAKRWNKAYEEITEVHWYDYVIFNDRLEEAVNRLHAIYLAEQVRQVRQDRRISDFLNHATGSLPSREAQRR